jgi:hypothetical protein
LIDHHEHQCEAQIAALSFSYRTILERSLDQKRRMFAPIRAIDQASWWIDHNGCTATQLAAQQWRRCGRPSADSVL